MADKQDEIALFPVTGWDLGPLKDMGAVMLRPHYLATPFDSVDTPHQDKSFVMSPAQARELAHSLLESAHLAETTESEKPPENRH